MKLRKFSVALIAMLSLSAFSASVAHAEFGWWEVSGSFLSGSAELKLEKKGSTPLEIAAPDLGIKLTATGLECVECTIYNDSTAHMAGTLRFTGVTVDEPEGCAIAPTFKTTALEGEVIMYEGGTYDKFFPKVPGRIVEDITLSECAMAGKYGISGTFAGRFSSATGEELVSQILTFDGTNTAGTGLTFGGKNATLMGEISSRLGGVYEKAAFGAW